MTPPSCCASDNLCGFTLAQVQVLSPSSNPLTNSAAPQAIAEYLPKSGRPKKGQEKRASAPAMHAPALHLINTILGITRASSLSVAAFGEKLGDFLSKFASVVEAGDIDLSLIGLFP